MQTTINDNIIIVELMIKLNVYCSSIFKIQILNDQLIDSVVTHRSNSLTYNIIPDTGMYHYICEYIHFIQ